MGPRHENRTLQAAKIFAAVSVVLIHGTFPDVPGEIVQALARFAVPLFFCIGGRYLIRSGADGKMDMTPQNVRADAGRRFLRILKLTVPVWLVYTVYSLIYRLACGESAASWAADKFNPGELFTFLMFNSGKVIYDYAYTYDHLWYLFALLYVFGLVFIFSPLMKHLYRPLTVILMAALFLCLLLQTYYPIRPFDISIRTWYVVRNWLLIGIPFVGVGMWSADGLMKKLRLNTCAAGAGLCLAGAAAAVAEYLYFGGKEIYLGSLLTVLGVLALAEAEEEGRGIALPDVLVRAGRELSGSIYLWHVLIFSLLILLTRGLEIYDLWWWIRPAVLILCSFAAAVLITRLRRLGYRGG